jgi:hypothetical protein
VGELSGRYVDQPRAVVTREVVRPVRGAGVGHEQLDRAIETLRAHRSQHLAKQCAAVADGDGDGDRLSHAFA